MKILRSLTLVIWAASSSITFASVSATQVEVRISEAKNSMNILMSTNDASIPRDLFNSAQCVANLQIYKAGFVFGGEGGHGVASCRDGTGRFGAPVFVDLLGGSWGLQIGLESVDLTLVFTNSNAKESLMANSFKLGAEAGLTVGPLGRDLSAATNYKLTDTIYSYSTAKGLFAGLTLEGSILTPDHSYDTYVYGKESPKEIINTTYGFLPIITLPYINSLNQY